MILIHCPYCEETLPELEFAYAGEAHIARPADPSLLNDAEWERYLFIRANPKGRSSMAKSGISDASALAPFTAPATTPR